MSTPLKMRGIGASKHESGEFAALSLYFPGRDTAGQQVYAFLTCEIHLIEGLRANLLIGNDIMSLEGFIIDIKRRNILIGSCGVTVPIDARQRGQFLTRRLLTSQDRVIPPRSEAMVSLVSLPLPNDRDFLFHPSAQTNLTLFTHLVDHQTSKVLVRNTTRDTLRILHRHKLGHLIDIAYENRFLADTHSVCDAATSPPSSQHLSNHDAGSSLLPTDASLETVLSNGFRVYGDSTAVEQIAELVAEYPTIWESQGFVQIPPERWMKVPLKPGWESKVSTIKPRIYPLSNEARHIVDDTFDKMYKQGRLQYTTDPTPFSFPVFVVYKTDHQGRRKGRAVIDIHKLSKLVLPDSYPLPLQSEIIANMQGCTNLAVLDTASFFYQWRLYPDHRFMFTVITHRGQETFQVPIMGYINSVAYIQREIDNILRSVRSWARAYIDDIVCGARSLPDLLNKLRTLFEIFFKYNISISPTKSFLNYPDVAFLGQQVNSLGLTTSE